MNGIGRELGYRYYVIEARKEGMFVNEMRDDEVDVGKVVVAGVAAGSAYLAYTWVDMKLSKTPLTM